MNHGSGRTMRALAALAIVAAISPAISPAPGAAQESDEILARMEYDRMRLYSGSGPGQNLAVLLQQARADRQAMPPGAAGPMQLISTRWRELGPDRVVSYDRYTAGRVSAVAIHPDDSNVIFAGGAQGGVWKSTNAGVSWIPLTDRECSLAMGHIAIDPEDHDIIYAGTGEQHFSGDSYYGCGVLRSVDGGETWQQQGAEIFVGRRNRGSGGAHISRVRIDRATAGSTSATTVLVASTYGLYRSTDSGAHWDLVLPGIATDLVAHPTADSVFYAAVYGEGVYKSTDTGSTWRSASAGMSLDGGRRINIAIAPSNPDILYTAIVLRGSPGFSMHRTDSGAEAWERLNATGADCRNQCWYDMTIAVDPGNPETVYFGAVGMFKSTDGGASFFLHHRDIYVDQHYLVFDTENQPRTLYLANDGGVYRTTSGGASWTSLATNLAVAQYYPGISLHPSDPGVTLGGTQDQGTQRSSAGTKVWVKVLGGDGGYTAFDAENPEIWYGEYQWISNSGYSGPLKNGYWAREGIDQSEAGLFIPPLVMDPLDSRRLYFGVRSLYRTDDAAEAWHRMYASPSERVVSAIGPASDGNTVYVGLTWGEMVVTRDGGETWYSGSGLPDRFLGDIAVHPDDPEQAYVVAGGFQSGHVYQTTDGGRSWQDRTGNLPDHPVNAVLYDPANLQGVFIGTDLGVFYSAGGGGAWSRLDDGLPTVAVFDLAAQPGTGRIVAATHGRGMFEIPVEVPLTVRTRPASLAEAMMEGDTRRLTGEVIVAPSGRNDFAASWEARSDASWLSLTSAAGQGRGRIQYEVSAGGLAAGDYSTAITVAVSGVADPVRIPLSLSVEEPLALPARRSASGYGVSEWSLAGADSLPAGLSGFGADTATWTASSGASGWIVIDRARGGADDPVVWSRSSRSLAPGVYEDTITVRVAGNPRVAGVIVDRFEVVGRMSVEDVTLDYLGVSRLAQPQRSFLMWFGNGDAVFDVGDVLRWFDHCRTHAADCRGSPSPQPEPEGAIRPVGSEER